MNYIALIPAIVELIKSVEVMLPLAQGKEKLGAVLSAITTVTGEAGDLAPKLSPLISAIVTLLNLLGVFKKSTAQ